LQLTLGLTPLGYDTNTTLLVIYIVKGYFACRKGDDMENGNIIAINNLVKRFDDITAVNGLNLEIRKGEMFGFLGPNGAGKTTTISILCGLLKPTAGSARIADFDIAKEPLKVKQLIGKSSPTKDL
jgi:ABC-type uncharacterized transport system ATPase subunit